MQKQLLSLTVALLITTPSFSLDITNMTTKPIDLVVYLSRIRLLNITLNAMETYTGTIPRNAPTGVFTLKIRKGIDTVTQPVNPEQENITITDKTFSVFTQNKTTESE